MNEKVRTSQITKSKFVTSYLRRSILPNLPWRKNEVTLLNSCDAKRFCDVSFILIFWIRGWVIFKNYFQDYSRLFFHFLAMTTAASQYSAAKPGRRRGRLKWLKMAEMYWRQLTFSEVQGLYRSKSPGEVFQKKKIHSFIWWTFSEMLTLFLARKKMAIWENGAFSAVGEGEIQFQNMVRSMIFSSCRFFEFLYILFLTFVIKFFDARVKVQPISISY